VCHSQWHRTSVCSTRCCQVCLIDGVVGWSLSLVDPGCTRRRVATLEVMFAFRVRVETRVAIERGSHALTTLRHVDIHGSTYQVALTDTQKSEYCSRPHKSTRACNFSGYAFVVFFLSETNKLLFLPCTNYPAFWPPMEIVTGPHHRC
jgi:hypothetical protein